MTQALSLPVPSTRDALWIAGLVRTFNSPQIPSFVGPPPWPHTSLAFFKFSLFWHCLFPIIISTCLVAALPFFTEVPPLRECKSPRVWSAWVSLRPRAAMGMWSTDICRISERVGARGHMACDGETGLLTLVGLTQHVRFSNHMRTLPTERTDKTQTRPQEQDRPYAFITSQPATWLTQAGRVK